MSVPKLDVAAKKRWTLAYLDLVEIPFDLAEKYGGLIEELDMTFNRITDLRFLSDFPKVETLILDHNNITSQVKMPLMSELHTLWVNHNKIKNLGVFIDTVSRNCPKLRFLSMMNNVAAPSYFNGGSYQQYVDFRYYVISKIPTLQTLDDRNVTPDERREAERIYRTPRKRSKKKNDENGGKSRENRSSRCFP